MKNNASKIVAAVLAQHADVTLPDVNMNPDHSGFLRYAILMGARIHILDQRWVNDEPYSTLRVQHAKQLQAIEVREEHLMTLETELPLLHLMAQYAKGTSIFPDPAEPSGKRYIVGDPSLLPKIRPHLKELLHV